jgi:ferredoxin
MSYVITDSCIKDLLCVDACPTDCIHPKKDEPAFEAATQLYVDPNGCIDCGACVPVCTSDSIHPIDELPEALKGFAGKNANFLRELDFLVPTAGQTTGRGRLFFESGALTYF